MVTTAFDNENDALEALTTIIMPVFEHDRQLLNRIDRWWRWNPKPLKIYGENMGVEHRDLRNMGETPWLSLVVTTLAQTLYLEGVDVPNDTDDHEVTKRMWLPWQTNRMRRRQIALHREAIAYGSAYAAVSYRDGVDGVRRAVIDCWSPRDSMAVYDDPASDTYPQMFMRRRRIDDVTNEIEMWDAYNRFVWTKRDGSNTWDYRGFAPHGGMDPSGNPVCPVIRYTNQMDLQGRTPGEVEPYIRMASRLNKDNYDRMLAQHYNSWKVRTATGLDMNGLSDSERAAKKLQLQHDSVLAGGDGVSFGTLPETSLDNLVASKQSDVEELAAVSQTPTTAFGKMVNVGDAGIEESRAGFYAKRDERRETFGVSHMDVLRLCAAVEGRLEDARRFDIEPMWKDTDTRTISQTVDALGKAAQMLNVPSELLWDQLPGISKTQADSWREYAAEHPDPDTLAAQVYQAQLNPAVTEGATDGGDQ